MLSIKGHISGLNLEGELRINQVVKLKFQFDCDDVLVDNYGYVYMRTSKLIGTVF